MYITSVECVTGVYVFSLSLSLSPSQEPEFSPGESSDRAIPKLDKKKVGMLLKHGSVLRHRVGRPNAKNGC